MLFKKKKTLTRSLLVDGAVVSYIISEKGAQRTVRVSWFFLLAGLLLFLFPFSQRAVTNTLYPETCLGDWEHASRAAGAPDGIGSDGSGAARLAHPDADMFCSSFSGEFDPESEILQASLVFSWHFGELPQQESGVPAEEAAVLEEESGVDGEEATEEADVFDGEVPSEDVVDAPEVTEPTESESISEDASDGTEEQEESESVSGVFKNFSGIFRRVHAQEVDATDDIPQDEAPQEETQSSTEETPNEPEETPTATSSSEDADVDETEVLIDEDVVDAEDSVDAEGGTTGVVSPEILSISYSTDGSSWTVLGSATRDAWQGLELRIPITSWDDVEKLQVLIQGVGDDEDTQVYVDAIGLVVLYAPFTPEDEFELLPHDIPPSNLPTVSVREPERNVTVDPDATHSCGVEPFSVRADSATTTIVHLTITENGEPDSYEAEILGAPPGIQVLFTNKKTAHHVPDAETILPIMIEVDEESQRGDFSVLFLVTKKGEKDSLVVCQMNLLSP